jgi:hypothetical protein
MKLFRIMVLLAAAVVSVSCGSKQEKNAPAAQQPAAKEAPLPEGYPAELALPEGYTANDIKVGDGTVSGGGKGVRSFVSYRLEKVFPGEKSALVEHYKKILTENGWQGEMKTPEPGYGYGTFAKANMELELKMNDMIFSLVLKAYQE